MKRIALTAATFALTSTLLIAGPEPIRSTDSSKTVVAPQPQPEMCNWTGFYIGGSIGGAFTANTDIDLDLTGEWEAFPEPSDETFIENLGNHDLDAAGLLAGGFLGYNYQWNHWVFGLEGDFSGSRTSGGTKFTQTAFSFVTQEPFSAITLFNTERTVQTTWSASLRGRVGYSRGPVMIYGTGGATWTDVEAWNNDKANTGFFFDGEGFVGSAFDSNKQKDEQVVFGATAGGGIEWAFTRIASMGLEYRHNWYDDDAFNFNAKNGPIFPGSTKVNLDGDQVTFRVNFLLGRVMKP